VRPAGAVAGTLRQPQASSAASAAAAAPDPGIQGQRPLP
jgi:hypothetical protein